MNNEPFSTFEWRMGTMLSSAVMDKDSTPVRSMVIWATPLTRTLVKSLTVRDTVMTRPDPTILVPPAMTMGSVSAMQPVPSRTMLKAPVINRLLGMVFSSF
jgi:hypothetical protein